MKILIVIFTVFVLSFRASGQASFILKGDTTVQSSIKNGMEVELFRDSSLVLPVYCQIKPSFFDSIFVDPQRGFKFSELELPDKTANLTDSSKLDFIKRSFYNNKYSNSLQSWRDIRTVLTQLDTSFYALLVKNIYQAEDSLVVEFSSTPNIELVYCNERVYDSFKLKDSIRFRLKINDKEVSKNDSAVFTYNGKPFLILKSDTKFILSSNYILIISSFFAVLLLVVYVLFKKRKSSDAEFSTKVEEPEIPLEQPIDEALRDNKQDKNEPIIENTINSGNLIGSIFERNIFYSLEKYKQSLAGGKYSLIHNQIELMIDRTDIPDYIVNFGTYLLCINHDIDLFYHAIQSNELKSVFKPVKEDIYNIENLLNIINDVEKLKEKLSTSDLLNYKNPLFFSSFIKTRCHVLFDIIGILYCYGQITVSGDKFEIIPEIKNNGLLNRLSKEMYLETRKFLLNEYDIEIRIARLFVESYNPALYEKNDFSILDTLPNVKSAINNLPKGIIYDIFSIGMVSDFLSLDEKPKVIYKY